MNYSILIIILVIIIGVGVGLAILLTNKSSDNKTATGSATYGITSNTFYDSSDDYKEAIRTASERWSRYINEDTTIDIKYYTFNDSTSSTLAYATMNDSNNIRGGGTITINVGRGAPPAGWDDVIEHEIGHVLGLPSATKWQNAIIYTGSGTFLSASAFPETAQAYYDLVDGATGNIPLQASGSHWDESTFTTELMTPSIGTEPELITSILTLTAMKELGWNIDLTQAEDF